MREFSFNELIQNFAIGKSCFVLVYKLHLAMGHGVGHINILAFMAFERL